MRLVGPLPLVARLEQVHVHAPAGRRRACRDGFEELVGAPLHARGPELHADEIRLDRARDLLDERDLVTGRKRRRNQPLAHRIAIAALDQLERALVVAVRDPVAVAQRHGEAHAYADVLGGARHLAGLIHQGHAALRAHVVHHHRPLAAERRACERDGRNYVRLDARRPADRGEPQLERQLERPQRSRFHRACVVVGVGWRRHGKESAALIPICGAHRCNPCAGNPEAAVKLGAARAGHAQQPLDAQAHGASLA